MIPHAPRPRGFRQFSTVALAQSRIMRDNASGMLTEEQIAAALAELPGWQQDGGRLRRIREFDDFASAMRFVHRIADLAEARNHHPEIHVTYRTVTLTLWSHDVGGVTERDLDFARAVES